MGLDVYIRSRRTEGRGEVRVEGGRESTPGEIDGKESVEMNKKERSDEIYPTDPSPSSTPSQRTPGAGRGSGRERELRGRTVAFCFVTLRQRTSVRERPRRRADVGVYAADETRHYVKG